MDTKSSPGYFWCGLFIRLVRYPQVLIQIVLNGSILPGQLDNLL